MMLLQVLAQAAPPGEDLWHNPLFIGLVIVFATAFIGALAAIFGYLMKSMIDGLREDIHDAIERQDKAQVEQRASDQQRVDMLGALAKDVDSMKYDEAQRRERERADADDRKQRQSGTDSRMSAIEATVHELKGQITAIGHSVAGRADRGT